MSPRFFLSYARANNGPLVRKFFDDLCLTIRGALSLTRTHPVGFVEETLYGPGSTWSDGAAQALQTCQAMVCLLSLSYFHSELAGKEWQLFELRRRKYGERPAPVTLPVSWITCSGPMPVVVTDILGRPDSIYQTQPITTMFKSSSLSEYAEFVKTLAYKIIDATAEVDPLPLESFPSMEDVQNAFYLWDRSIASDRNRRHEPDDKLFYAEPIGPAPFKEAMAREHSDTTSDTPSTTQRQSASSLSNQTNERKYSTFAISKNRKVLDMVEDSCRLFPFQVTRHDDPAHAMYRVRMYQSDKQELPELFVVDLDGGNDGLEAVKELSEKLDVPSGILALSSKFDPSILYEAKGATILFKNFDRRELVSQMELCAKRGRNIRNFRKTKVLDSSRQRQVFFSYRSEDKDLATVLRRSLEAEGIGVSYMDEIEAKGKWKDKIETWLGQAHMFLALVTKTYLSSKWCEGELARFTHLVSQAESNVQTEQRRLNLISVLFDSPKTHENEFIEGCINEYERVEMSYEDFLNGRMTLVARIQDFLESVNALHS